MLMIHFKFTLIITEIQIHMMLIQSCWQQSLEICGINIIKNYGLTFQSVDIVQMMY